MRYLELPPPPPLARSLECLWTLERDGDAATDAPTTPERVLPDGTVELVVHFATPFEEERAGRWLRQPRAFVVGPMSRALRLRPTAGARVLGIRMRSTGAASLVRAPLRELADRVLALGDLFERGFEEELLGDGWQEPARLAERAVRALGERLAPPAEGAELAERATRRIFASRGTLRVRELAAELGVGERRLQRSFDLAVGLSPKRLARVARLQAVLHAFASPSPSLAGIAADCGYSDQAHFTHELRELVGVSPAEFLAERHELSDLFAAEERLERLLTGAGSTELIA